MQNFFKKSTTNNVDFETTNPFAKPVNNQKVMNAFIESDYSNPVLGGQNPTEYLVEAANEIVSLPADYSAFYLHISPRHFII